MQKLKKNVTRPATISPKSEFWLKKRTTPEHFDFFPVNRTQRVFVTRKWSRYEKHSILFEKSKNFHKKGLGWVCAPIRHTSKFWLRVQTWKSWNFGFWSRPSKCACRVQILTPSPFWMNSGIFYALGSFYWSFRWIIKKSYFGHIWAQIAPKVISAEISTLILGAVAKCLVSAHTVYGAGVFTRCI